MDYDTWQLDNLDLQVYKLKPGMFKVSFNRPQYGHVTASLKEMFRFILWNRHEDKPFYAWYLKEIRPVSKEDALSEGYTEENIYGVLDEEIQQYIPYNRFREIRQGVDRGWNEYEYSFTIRFAPSTLSALHVGFESMFQSTGLDYLRRAFVNTPLETYQHVQRQLIVERNSS